jgi:HEAT repeat protein
LDSLASAPAATSPVAPDRLPDRLPEPQRLPDQRLSARLATLETAVTEMQRLSQYLMENGRAPLDERMREEMARRLIDPAATDQQRLRALRLLREGGALAETAVVAAVDWLNTATNSGLREDILSELEGMTNSVLQSPLLQLALNDADEDVRSQAIENLGRFATDPQVEATLWSVLSKDPSNDVREEAANELARLPVTDARRVALEKLALDPNASLDLRLVALQSLQRANAKAPDTLAAVAQVAHTSDNPAERARWFEAFDGFNDPVLKAPLVHGLQDPNPMVRESAADALSAFRSDPAVMEWLKYIAMNDADPEVRREALQAMGN